MPDSVRPPYGSTVTVPAAPPSVTVAPLGMSEAAPAYQSPVG